MSIILDGLKQEDDPGIAHLDRLAAGGSIDQPIRRYRHPSYPRCMLARLCGLEAAVLALISFLIWAVLVAS